MFPEIQMDWLLDTFFDFVLGDFSGVFISIFGVLAGITFIDYLIFLYNDGNRPD